MQALLVLDVMNAIFELPFPLHDPNGFVESVGELLARARVRRVPVVHFRQLGPEGRCSRRVGVHASSIRGSPRRRTRS